jgi:hypothetical protein
MIKAASPKKLRVLAGGVGEFIARELAHPRQMAFSDDRLVECLGAWRVAGNESVEAEAPAAPCSHCGAPRGTSRCCPSAPGWPPPATTGGRRSRGLGQTASRSPSSRNTKIR